MKDAAQDDFLIAPGLTMLNHASYGISSRRVLAAADLIREEIESDPIRFLGSALTDRLREQTNALAALLGLDPHLTTLCANATSGAASIIDSVALLPGATVVAFDTEYSSILRAWDRACERAGAALITVPVQLPFTGPDQLLAELDARVPGKVTYLQMSLVSSSSAIHFPINELATWAHARGGRVILDAAHGPGHVPVEPDVWGIDAMFATVHKWLPTLRPVGLLWLAPDLVTHVRPAEVSLTWDSDDLVDRFSWPGTFDPVPRLSLGTAIEQWSEWDRGKALTECQELADLADELLVPIGAKPTAVRPYLPPRLHAFVLDWTTVAQTKQLLHQAGIRAWVGPGANGECILRIATHVYNDTSDIEAVREALQR